MTHGSAWVERLTGNPYEPFGRAVPASDRWSDSTGYGSKPGFTITRDQVDDTALRTMEKALLQTTRGLRLAVPAAPSPVV
jgi:hypothetical protein